eukprot:scaffold2844_cov326-Pavlova_lutheri.AAC.4
MLFEKCLPSLVHDIRPLKIKEGHQYCKMKGSEAFQSIGWFNNHTLEMHATIPIWIPNVPRCMPSTRAPITKMGIHHGDAKIEKGLLIVSCTSSITMNGRAMHYNNGEQKQRISNGLHAQRSESLEQCPCSLLRLGPVLSTQSNARSRKGAWWDDFEGF